MDLNEHIIEAREKRTEEISNRLLNLSEDADPRDESFDELLSIIDDMLKGYEI